MGNKDNYEVTVNVTVKVKVLTSAHSFEEAYDNVKSDFENDSKDFLDNYDYEIIEDSYDEVDAELQDEPW